MSGEEPIGAQAQEPETEAGSAARRPDRIRAWFAGLGRALTALVVTLVVLGLLGGVTDVVLHEVRHTNTSTTAFQGVNSIVVVLDGDVSLTVMGDAAGAGRVVTLTAADTSTPFDDPQRSTNLIGATLYLTEHCPDSRCSAQLTLTMSPNTHVSVTAGNALRMNSSVIAFDGLSEGATVSAAPAKVLVTDTVVHGAVFGTLSCDSVPDCLDVATAKD